MKQKIGPSTTTRGTFYELTLEYSERWQSKYGDQLSRISEQARQTLQSLNQAGNTFLYSGAAYANEPVPQEEKKAVLKALGELDSLNAI